MSGLSQFNLNNSIECTVKEIPSSNSLTMGIFLDVGLPYEEKSEGGISHFLEHMCFRGTRNRTAYEITQQVDALGGYINAYTSKEYTCYYITVLPESMEQGIDILFDVVFNSVHKEESITLEKSIIAEEIKMYEDTPDEKILDMLSQNMFPSSFHGKPILGTEASISAFNSDIINNYYQHYFYEDNIKVVIAGNVLDSVKLKKLLRLHFSNYEFKLKKTSASNQAIRFKQSNEHLSKPLEQNHLCMGFPGLKYLSKDRYSLSILSTLMGGSMSSRLFQSVREKMGLAYSIYSSASFYKETGVFSIYAGTSPENLNDAKLAINEQLSLLLEDGILESELERGKKQLKGNIIINLESSMAWVGWLGRNIIYKSSVSSVDEVINKLDSITKKDIKRVSNNIINTKEKVVVSLGPILKNKKKI